MNTLPKQHSNDVHDSADTRWTSPTPQQLLRGPILLGYVVIGLFFGGLGTWAALADISSAIVASGVVSPEGSRKTVQHLEGGIITEILVDDGDEVQAGDPLVILQEIQVRAAFEVLDGQRQFLAAKLARLLAEQRGQDAVNFPKWLLEAEQKDAELKELLAAQRDHFITRREVHEGRKAIGRKRINELEEEVIGWKNQIKSQEKQLRLLDKELGMKGTLLKEGIVARTEHMKLQRMEANIEGEMAESTASLARAKQSIGETELQIVNEDSLRIEDIVKELAATRSELDSVKERLFAQRDILDRTSVVAPVSGIIVNKQFHTTGGVVGPAQALLDIVPQNAELLIDARVMPVDIDEVTSGQTARVHFLSFVDRRLPQIKGIVRWVSADTLMDDISGQSYYHARVEVPQQELAKLGKNVKITPGMPAEVLIVTGERTFLEYLIHPLIDSLRRSFREN